jgi:hypothetical protein
MVKTNYATKQAPKAPQRQSNLDSKEQEGTDLERGADEGANGDALGRFLGKYGNLAPQAIDYKEGGQANAHEQQVAQL